MRCQSPFVSCGVKTKTRNISFVLLTVFERPWALRSPTYSVKVSVHFLFKVDLVLFSLLFACFDFSIYIFWAEKTIPIADDGTVLNKKDRCACVE